MNEEETELAERITDTGIEYPSDYFVCPTTAPLTTTDFKISDYEDIALSIIKQYEELPATFTDN